MCSRLRPPQVLGAKPPKFGHRRLKIGAQPPHNLGSSVAALKPSGHCARHRGARHVEPSRPAAGELFFKFRAHWTCTTSAVFPATTKTNPEKA